jgi:outer membrane receptor for ferrienterochelin and colicin
MFAGFDNIDTTNAAFVGGLGRVKPEFVNNVESGINHRGRTLDLNLSVFDMQFRNEITPVGALSYIGLPLRKNVGSSRRSGLELDGMWRGHSRVVIGANATWMRARIAEYTDDATQQRHQNVVPLLTPAFTTNHSAQVLVTGALRVSLDGRYVGRSFLANNSDARFVTPPGYVLDGATTWTTTRVSLMVLLRNALDRRFFSGGYTDGSTSYYYIWAPRNLTITTRVRF